MTEDLKLILDRLNSIDRRLEMLEIIAMKAKEPEPLVVHGTQVPETMWVGDIGGKNDE